MVVCMKRWHWVTGKTGARKNASPVICPEVTHAACLHQCMQLTPHLTISHLHQYSSTAGLATHAAPTSTTNNPVLFAFDGPNQ